ncbi:MAG: hypothetical protein A3B13_01160 [Candidatus Liptonbacteria bacterium RIFCSPLOWO2_01_FULL_45_15]|uniref:Addiction module toxin, HicA family n=1 Tax=Candidatus Liptonbacteria bacterium RIFCSPLOWO2_01_FULL_45_15 TaxID=1798649 RepID=A0A1G2CFZ3_9BACT|nr:MAG: hypothetical protein A3B13_01160 [Candidatus Liptonbacteria bacterium RIFCSPLOWO2_01_FULL_45_15]
MTQLPLLSGRQVVKILEKIGYRVIRQRGSHIRLSCPGRKSVTVPNYRIIDRSLLKKLLRDIEIEPREFLNW